MLSSNRRSSDEGVINLCETIADVVQMDGGLLKKPIVAILNDVGAKTKDHQKVYGSHWALLCILPNNYQPKSEKIKDSLVGNEIVQETRVILLDPYYNDPQIPLSLRMILSYGYEYQVTTDEGVIEKFIPKLDENITFSELHTK